MRTIRRLIYGEIFTAVAYVLLAFLSLFFFFDVVDELPSLGKPSALGDGATYELRHALLYVLLLVPNRVYELLPIAVLIGSVLVMARLAQSSEFTILRTSGLGPWRALRSLLGLGLFFVVITLAVGDYLAPLADRSAQMLKARFEGGVNLGQTGAWLKERKNGSSYSVNVGGVTALGALSDVRVFEMDSRGFLASALHAETGQVGDDGAWHLKAVSRREFNTGADTVSLRQETRPDYRWPTELTTEMVSVALLNPDRMRTTDLYAYIQHLESNGQTAQKHEIEFWRKVFYPLSCLVMVVLALPFAYLHFRSGGIAGYVFGGVMTGISFFLLNNVFGYVGNLNQWQPWLAAAAPAMIYSLMSLGAFGWLVFKR